MAPIVGFGPDINHPFRITLQQRSQKVVVTAASAVEYVKNQKYYLATKGTLLDVFCPESEYCVIRISL